MFAWFCIICVILRCCLCIWRSITGQVSRQAGLVPEVSERGWNWFRGLVQGLQLGPRSAGLPLGAEMSVPPARSLGGLTFSRLRQSRAGDGSQGCFRIHSHTKVTTPAFRGMKEHVFCQIPEWAGFLWTLAERGWSQVAGPLQGPQSDQGRWAYLWREGSVCLPPCPLVDRTAPGPQLRGSGAGWQDCFRIHSQMEVWGPTSRGRNWCLLAGSWTRRTEGSLIAMEGAGARLRGHFKIYGRTEVGWPAMGTWLGVSPARSLNGQSCSQTAAGMVWSPVTGLFQDLLWDRNLWVYLQRHSQERLLVGPLEGRTAPGLWWVPELPQRYFCPWMAARLLLLRGIWVGDFYSAILLTSLHILYVYLTVYL